MKTSKALIQAAETIAAVVADRPSWRPALEAVLSYLSRHARNPEEVDEAIQEAALALLEGRSAPSAARATLRRLRAERLERRALRAAHSDGRLVVRYRA